MKMETLIYLVTINLCFGILGFMMYLKKEALT